MRYVDCEWPISKCILCLSTGSITREHLIPECLGGRLVRKFLCEECNSNLGHQVESKVKDDPGVRKGLDRLAFGNPELANELHQGLAVIVNSEQGPLRGFHRDNEVIIDRQTLDDGSRILPEGEALASVQRKAERRGEQLLELTPNEVLTISDSGVSKTTFTPVEPNSIEPNLSGEEMSPVVPAKIAFEFLALHCGKDIYGDAPQLKALRDQIRACDLTEDEIRIERLEGERETLLHGIVFEENHPGARIQVRLFGKLAWRVSFRRLSVTCPRFCYTHNLISGEEGWTEAAEV